MKPETKFKNAVVNSIKSDGGYARRIEDQYGVGIYDIIVIPKGCIPFFVEAKIIRSESWGPTPRQASELRRIRRASNLCVPCVLGLHSNNNAVTFMTVDKAVIYWSPIGHLTYSALFRGFLAELRMKQWLINEK